MNDEYPFLFAVLQKKILQKHHSLFLTILLQLLQRQRGSSITEGIFQLSCYFCGTFQRRRTPERTVRGPLTLLHFFANSLP